MAPKKSILRTPEKNLCTAPRSLWRRCQEDDVHPIKERTWRWHEVKRVNCEVCQMLTLRADGQMQGAPGRSQWTPVTHTYPCRIRTPRCLGVMGRRMFLICAVHLLIGWRTYILDPVVDLLLNSWFLFLSPFSLGRQILCWFILWMEEILHHQKDSWNPKI